MDFHCSKKNSEKTMRIIFIKRTIYIIINIVCTHSPITDIINSPIFINLRLNCIPGFFHYGLINLTIQPFFTDTSTMN